MGRRKEKAVKFIISILFLFFVQNVSYAQTKISGLVSNKNNTLLYSVSIVLKDTLNYSILNNHFSTKTAIIIILNTSYNC